VRDVFTSGIKLRLADSLATSSPYGSIGLAVGYQPERVAQVDSDAGRVEWRLGSKWSVGLVFAAGIELMIVKHVGIDVEVREHVFAGTNGRSGPDTLGISAGLVNVVY
jgi:hypothetical protein